MVMCLHCAVHELYTSSNIILVVRIHLHYDGICDDDDDDDDNDDDNDDDDDDDDEAYNGSTMFMGYAK